jgi:hypothetical protein
MTTNQIASRLVELCRQGQWKTAQQELFAQNAVSIEPYATPAFEKETKGLNAIFEKADKFDAMVETMHKVEVSDAVVAGNSFACTIRMDCTMKGQGRMDMTELCVYQVKDGKVIQEEFFV